MKYSQEFTQALRRKVMDVQVPRFNVPVSVQLLANMRNAITDTCIPVTHIVTGTRVWRCFVSDHTIAALLKPNTDREDVLSGYVSQLFSFDIIAEDFEHPEHICLNPNVLILVALNTDHKATWNTENPVIELLDAVATLVN